jgi:hypothetical protein
LASTWFRQLFSIQGTSVSGDMRNFIEPTPRRMEIPENVTVIQLVKKFRLKVTSRFITVFTKA